MSPNILSTCGFRTALLGSVAGTLALALVPSAVFGETANEIVITGSRIPQSNLTTTSPVAQIGNVNIELGGTSRVEDVVKSLPQVFSTQSSTVSNASSGTATLDLRNLGTPRTLVLVNSRRMAPGDSDSPFADLNTIPGSLVDHIDIVTGGASAVYGADAVAGVVNFIMKSDFEGVQLDGSYSFYNHKNTNETLQAVVAARAATNPRFFQVPPTNYNGGAIKSATLTIGANFADDKGNVTAYLDYRNVAPILQSHYDYSACSLNSGTSWTCGGSSTTSPPRLITLGGVGPSVTPTDVLGTLGPYSSATGAFNFGPYNYYQRPDTRHSAGFFAHYKVGPSFEVYSEAMFMDDNTDAQIAPSGNFLDAQVISCDNPFIANPAALGCGVVGLDQDPTTAAIEDFTAFGSNAAGGALVLVGKRNVEGGGRDDVKRHESYRMVVGARGDISETWTYDIFGQYGQTILADIYLHDISIDRVGKSLDVHLVGGVPTCQSVIDGSDTACVPWNIFQIDGVTSDQLAYIERPGLKQGITTEQVVGGSVNGEMGFKFPMAAEHVKVAAGFEYRRETLKDLHDFAYTTGDLSGQGGAEPDVTGSFDVQEVFAEVRMPLVQNLPWFKDVTVGGGYRYSRYSTGAKTDTYRLDANYSPTDDFRFRASYNRAIRAPNITELFSPISVNLDGSADPCAGPVVGGLTGDGFNAAQCANTGVSAAQFGLILPSSAGQYYGRQGGNPDLKPEIGNTWSFGVVATPAMVPGLSASIDYFDIKINHLIGIIGADLILFQCAETGNPALCGLIHRQPGTGSLWLSTDGFVDDTNLNTGSVQTQGVDIQVAYRADLADLGAGNWGAISAHFFGTSLLKYHVNPLPGSSVGNYDCVGFFGIPNCASNPYPDWRHSVSLTWETPWPVSLGAAWRYISSVSHESDSHPTWLDSTFPAVSYFDFNATWEISNSVGLRAGLNNAFDENPPLVGTDPLTGTARGGSSQFQNGNTIPSLYDPRGRLFFLGFTIRG